MTAEAITNTIGHIFRFFLPPILNILALSMIVGESLGIGAGVFDLAMTVKQIVATYIGATSELIFNTSKSLLPEINAGNVANLNIQGILQSAITDFGEVTKSFGLFAILLFIFLAFAIDRITLLVAAQVKNLAWLANRFLYAPFIAKLPVIQRIDSFVSDNFLPVRPAIAQRYARTIFTRSNVEEPLDAKDLQGVVRAWLSQNAKDSFWFSSHNAADERISSLKLAADYFRIYSLLSVILCLYSFIRNPSIRDVLFPLAMLVVLGLIRLAHARAEISLNNCDLSEFFYHRTALYLHTARGEARSPTEP